MSWRLALGGVVGFFAVVGLFLASVAVFTDSTLAPRLVRTSNEPLSTQDPDCAARSRDPSEAGPWRRVWRLQGEASVDETRARGLPFWPGRQLVVWENVTRMEADLPGSVRGDWSGEGRASLFASDAEVPFGFSFELLDGSGDMLCGLAVTLPLDRENVTYHFEPMSRLKWLSLDLGESATSETRSGETLSITRLAESEWEFVVDGNGGPGNHVDNVRLFIVADVPTPPWGSVDLDLEFDTFGHRATAHLELRGPVLCPGRDGHDEPCP